MVRMHDHSFMHASTYLFVHLFVHSNIHLLVHLFVQSSILLWQTQATCLRTDKTSSKQQTMQCKFYSCMTYALSIPALYQSNCVACMYVSSLPVHSGGPARCVKHADACSAGFAGRHYTASAAALLPIDLIECLCLACPAKRNSCSVQWP